MKTQIDTKQKIDKDSSKITIETMHRAVKLLDKSPKERYLSSVKMLIICKKHWEEVEKELPNRDSWGIRVIIRPYLKKPRLIFSV